MATVGWNCNSFIIAMSNCESYPFYFGTRVFLHGRIFVENAQSGPVKQWEGSSGPLPVTAPHCSMLSGTFRWKSTESTPQISPCWYQPHQCGCFGNNHRNDSADENRRWMLPLWFHPSAAASPRHHSALAVIPSCHRPVTGTSHLVAKRQRRVDKTQQETRQVY